MRDWPSGRRTSTEFRDLGRQAPRPSVAATHIMHLEEAAGSSSDVIVNGCTREIPIATTDRSRREDAQASSDDPAAERSSPIRVVRTWALFRKRSQRLGVCDGHASTKRSS